MKEHKQIDLQLLRFWKNDKVPTKVGFSLSLSQCKVALLLSTQCGDTTSCKTGYFFKLKGKRANQ